MTFVDHLADAIVSEGNLATEKQVAQNFPPGLLERIYNCLPKQIRTESSVIYRQRRRQLNRNSQLNLDLPIEEKWIWGIVRWNDNYCADQEEAISLLQKALAA